MGASPRATLARGRYWVALAAVLLLTSCGPVADRAVAAPPVAPPATATDPGGCPITRPQQPQFVPPAPQSAILSGEFWYGTPSLWTSLRPDGTWQLSHREGAYGQKVFWWRQGYNWRAEPEPPLTVTGRRIDAPASPLVASTATNAYAADIGSAMLVGVEMPVAGCWQITGYLREPGNLRGAQLSFIVWVPA
jgi:hypothetical protein